MTKFKLVSKYQPTGDQPRAIKQLTDGVLAGVKEQTLLGVTGSGKTFTMMGNRRQIPGLYLLAAFDIFTLLQNYIGYSIWVSFYEIYSWKS